MLYPSTLYQWLEVRPIAYKWPNYNELLEKCSLTEAIEPVDELFCRGESKGVVVPAGCIREEKNDYNECECGFEL